MKRTLTVSESRRLLPSLLQEIARGGGPFYIGARGVPTAVLVSVAEHEERTGGGTGLVAEGARPWAALRVEIVSPSELADDIRSLRREAAESVVKRWDRRAAPRRKPARRT